MESNLSKLATSEISTFYLVSGADETGLSLALAQNPKTGFVASSPNYDAVPHMSCLAKPVVSGSELVAQGYLGVGLWPWDIWDRSGVADDKRLHPCRNSL